MKCNPDTALEGNIVRLYNELATLDDLSPSLMVDRYFSDLVHSALLISKVSLPVELVSNIQRLCSRGEFALEKYWSMRVTASNNPWEVLRCFPYYKNYEQLTDLEYQTLTSCDNHKKHRILFCGGGPLPLTAIILSAKYGEQVTIMDNNPTAVSLASNLLRVLGLETCITVILDDATTYESYAEFNTVFMAAMAGSTNLEKKTVFTNLQKQIQPDTHILARSSWAGRTLLYEPVSDDILNLFNLQAEMYPAAPIVNSILVLKK